MGRTSGDCRILGMGGIGEGVGGGGRGGEVGVISFVGIGEVGGVGFTGDGSKEAGVGVVIR